MHPYRKSEGTLFSLAIKLGYLGAYQIIQITIAKVTNPMTNFFMCFQQNLKPVFCRPLRSTDTDKIGQDHLTLAGSDLLPARSQSLMRQRIIFYLLPMWAEELIDGRCRRLSKA
jgi:hypothetical protein